MTDNRVCYDAVLFENSVNYPICRIPKKGVIVRSHRFDKFKESNADFYKFKYELERIFSPYYIVSDVVRINTVRENRPFDLDLALMHRKDGGIRINIEVDEPYSFFSREARHCIGEDIHRDDYFIERGWLVVRFSEIQVHRNIEGCLKYIAELVSQIDTYFEVSSSFLNYSRIKDEPLWDIVQAQKWEKASYRETYIEREFPALQNPSNELDRSLNAQEIYEEEEVLTSFSGLIEFIKDHRNRHIRDERIQFHAKSHKYFIDGVPVPSASALIRKFFPEFDALGAAGKLRPSNPLYGMSVDEIVANWNDKGKEASDKGTILHEQIENYYLGDEYNLTDEFWLFESFATDHSFLEPYRCEWRIFDEEFGLAGTIDFIAENEDKLEMYDWKRSKKVVDPSSGKPIETDKWGKQGIGRLANIDDTSYNHYCLQQSLYRFILEKNYGIEISKMFLVVIHPDYPKYYKVEVPYLQNYVAYILNTL